VATIIVLCDDMMFASRITGTAAGLGLTCKAVRSQEAAESEVSQQPAACLIIDLANPGLQIADLLARLRPEGTDTPFVVAFGSHVDSDTLNAARAAGCDVVVPRSKFVSELPSALARWCGQ
jgi:CheY-like chemotaxis protein